MSPSSAPVGEQRPGGRSARVRAAVLSATLEVLVETGYDAMSVDAVAARAGVHKTTVYRRWPTKAALVAAAAADRSEQLVPVPDTGSLVGDLTALGHSIADNLSSELGSALARTIIAAASASAEVAEVNREFWTVRLALTETIVDRAVDRGEVSADVDRRAVIETLIGPIYVRLLLTGEPFDAPFVADVAVMVARGVGAPAT
jgi:AcrR family transcriptional regulator